MVKDFRASLGNREDATHHMAIYTGTPEFIKHKSHNKRYMLHKQLHTLEVCIYHGIKVRVGDVEGEHISPMCQCPKSQIWHREK